MQLMLRLSVFLGVFPALFAWGNPSEAMRSIVLTPSQSILVNHLSIREDGAAVLSEGSSCGECVWEVSCEKQLNLARIQAYADIPSATGMTPASDVILQYRLLQCNEAGYCWSEWLPRNILPGGDFRDSNGNGIPDGVEILEFNGKRAVWTDRPRDGLSRYFHDVHEHATPLLSVAMDDKRAFRFTKSHEDGQVIVQMHSDRIPTGAPLTVSGWNGWDLGTNQTMGLMSRFHELDAQGNRLNKIMFIGDDDWHQPGGRSTLKWRAVTFVPRERARRLNLYAARLISSSGTLETAQYQIQQDSLADKRHLGKCLADFSSFVLKEWSLSDSDLVSSASDCLSISPRPHSNAFALSPAFELHGVNRACLVVEMDVQVPERYDDLDPSHKAWASTYLELLDSAENVVDVIKLSVCRPRFGGVLASAGEVPPEAIKARLRLVASHQSYLQPHQKANMDGEMLCRWRNIRVYESLYPQEFRSRLDEQPPKPNEIAVCGAIQIRSLFLSDSPEESPILHSVCCEMK